MNFQFEELANGSIKNFIIKNATVESCRKRELTIKNKNFSNTIFKDLYNCKIKFFECNFEKCSFIFESSEISLEKSHIINSITSNGKIDQFNILQSTIKETSFLSLKLNNCIFLNSRFENSYFEDSEIKDLLINESKIIKSKFIKCILTKPIFGECTIEESDFSSSQIHHSEFKNINFDKKTQWPEKFLSSTSNNETNHKIEKFENNIPNGKNDIVESNLILEKIKTDLPYTYANNLNLINLNIFHKNFKHLTLKNSVLLGFSIDHAHITNINLECCKIYGVNFENLNTDSITIKDSVCQGFVLTDCKIIKINFINSHLINVNLKNLNQSFFNFQNCTFDITTSFPEKINNEKNLLYGPNIKNKNHKITNRDFKYQNFLNSEFHLIFFEGVSFVQNKYKNTIFLNCKFLKTSFEQPLDKINNLNLENCELNHSNLKNIHFDFCNFRQSTFNFCNFKKILIQNTDLQNVNFQNCNFEETTIENCIYNDHTLWPSHFDYKSSNIGPNSNLSNKNILIDNKNNILDLSRSNLTNTNLSNVNCKDIIIKDAIYNHLTQWPNGFHAHEKHALGPSTQRTNEIFKDIYFNDIDFSFSDFKKSSFENVVFNNCNLQDSNFTETKLNKVEFNNCDLKYIIYNHQTQGDSIHKIAHCGFGPACQWHNTLIENKTIENINFSKSKFKNVDFVNCKFLHCDFSNSEFIECTFKNCTFSEIIFIKFIFKRSKSIDSHFNQCKFDESDLQYSDLSTNIFHETSFNFSIIYETLLPESLDKNKYNFIGSDLDLRNKKLKTTKLPIKFENVKINLETYNQSSKTLKDRIQKNIDSFHIENFYLFPESLRIIKINPKNSIVIYFNQKNSTLEKSIIEEFNKSIDYDSIESNLKLKNITDSCYIINLNHPNSVFELYEAIDQSKIKFTPEQYQIISFIEFFINQNLIYKWNYNHTMEI